MAEEKTARVYTADEQRALLVGYTDLARELWEAVSVGTEVRYVLKTGEFKRGGKIEINPWMLVPTGTTKPREPFFRVKFRDGDRKRGPGMVTVAYADVERLYVRVSSEAQLLQKTIEDVTAQFNQRMRQLTIAHREQAIRLAQLETRVGELDGKSSAPRRTASVGRQRTINE